MTYQLRLLADMSDVAEPGPLPAAVRHLTNPELADLSWLTSIPSYSGKGFFPVDIEPAPLVRRISTIAFMQRIPAAKRIAVRTAGKTNVIIEDFLDLLAKTALVELDHADTIAGVGYLVSEALITAEDAEAVLA